MPLPAAFAAGFLQLNAAGYLQLNFALTYFRIFGILMKKYHAPVGVTDLGGIFHGREQAVYYPEPGKRIGYDL